MVKVAYFINHKLSIFPIFINKEDVQEAVDMTEARKTPGLGDVANECHKRDEGKIVKWFAFQTTGMQINHTPSANPWTSSAHTWSRHPQPLLKPHWSYQKFPSTALLLLTVHIGTNSNRSQPNIPFAHINLSMRHFLPLHETLPNQTTHSTTSPFFRVLPTVTPGQKCLNRCFKFA